MSTSEKLLKNLLPNDLLKVLNNKNKLSKMLRQLRNSKEYSKSELNTLVYETCKELEFDETSSREIAEKF